MNLQLTWLRACGAYVALMFPAAVLATDVTGSIDADTTWSSVSSPYVIKDNVTVNASLIIEPDVQVQFAGPYTLKIAGTLIARGTQEITGCTPGSEVVFTVPPGSATVAARLMFTGGTALFDTNGAYQSGSIIECVIVEKIGGIDSSGAVVLNGAHPYIHNSIFRNNGASGIYAYLIDGDLRIENNLIDNNSAALGGGLYIIMQPKSRLSLRDNVVRNNTVSGAGFGNGGGLHLTMDDSVATLNANIFENNQASNTAGGIYLVGGTGVISTNAVTISGGSIQGNHAVLRGGGGFTDKVALGIDAATVRDNVAELDNGGGLYLQQSEVTITKSMLLRNRSMTMGGGIYLQVGTYAISDSVLAMNSSDFAHGGGIDMHGFPHVTINRSVVAGNKARDYGAGVSMTEGICSVTNSAVVLNESANAIGIYVEANLLDNTIAYNSAEEQSQSLGGTIGVGENASQKLAINGNNIFNNVTPYDIVSYDSGTVGNEAVVNARSNWWGDASIASRLKIGDGVLSAAIDASSPSSGPNLNAPISPPGGVTSLQTVGSIKLLWQANPESDVSGYRVYWGTKPAPDFDYFADVPSGTSYEILDPVGGFVAVTAYDADYHPSNNDPATPVNENQTLGHESWYAVPSSTISMQAEPAKHLKNGGLVAFVITVTNTGPSVGNGDFIVTHTLSPGLSYYYSSTSPTNPDLPPGCQLSSPTNDRQVTCTHAKLEQNSSATITIRALVTTSETSEVVSTATVRPNNFDINAAYNEAQVRLHVNAPDVAVSWTKKSEIKVGTSAEYQVVVKNNGQVSAVGTVLDIIVPANISFNTPPDWQCLPPDASGNTMCSHRIDMLSGNAQVPIAFSLTGTAPGEVALVAEVATAGDSDAANNQARITTTVISQVAGNGDSGGGINPPANNKKGGGTVELMWLLMLLPLLAIRRRYNYFSAV